MTPSFYFWAGLGVDFLCSRFMHICYIPQKSTSQQCRIMSNVFPGIIFRRVLKILGIDFMILVVFPRVDYDFPQKNAKIVWRFLLFWISEVKIHKFFIKMIPYDLVLKNRGKIVFFMDHLIKKCIFPLK